MPVSVLRTVPPVSVPPPAPVPPIGALTFDVRPETAGDAAWVDDLHERVFGPGRYARAAYRLREGGAPPDPRLSLVATFEGRQVGSVRLTPIAIGGTPALLLGPLAVEPGLKGRGAGKLLVRASLAAATAAGHGVVLLVGDEPYYGPLGFRQLEPYRVTLPGPADPGRVLLAELRPGALVGVAGMATAARPAAGGE